MARLPFNPDRDSAQPSSSSRSRSLPDSRVIRGGAASGTNSGGGKVLTVSQISHLIKDALAAGLPPKVRVVGEVSNFSERAHWFFSLKDEGGSLRCVCFASAARRVSFPVADGMEVVATGRIDYFDAQGSLQLYVDALEPVGQGALEARYKALCEELRRAGYFDNERKKRLPSMPYRVAVVTSRSGAALQDVINTAGRRWGGCELLLVDVRVQGAAAAPEIAAAIDALSRQGKSLGIDAVILTRGGGSIEDLWAFNERVVADAIFRCALPIVAAIGHETDQTIAELVADVRCSTPTQAAMTLIPDRRTLQQQVTQLADRMTRMLRNRAESSRQRLASLARHAMFRRPERMVDPYREKFARLRERLVSSLPGRVKADADKLAALSRQLQAVGPLNVLQRGYSLTLGPDGKVLRSAGQVSPGVRITSVLADGRVSSEVVDGGEVPPPRTQRKSKSQPRRAADETTLFGDSSAPA